MSDSRPFQDKFGYEVNDLGDTIEVKIPVSIGMGLQFGIGQDRVVIRSGKQETFQNQGVFVRRSGMFEHALNLPAPVNPQSARIEKAGTSVRIVMQKISISQLQGGVQSKRKLKELRVDEADSARTSGDHSLPE